MPRASDVATLVSSARDAGLDVALEVDGELDNVEPTVGLAAYRVVQESIANARHHAPGAPVEVSMAVRCGHLDVTVHNRAVEMAIDPDEDQRHGTGLVGMHERAAACHGDLWAGPTDDGWEVRCRLPLAKARS
jgi:signal transduction histidine kinase